MKYKYRNDCIVSKKIKAKEVAKLPKNIDLRFSIAHIRIYKAEDCFHCSLAIPAFKDDEGHYVLELDFSENSNDDEYDRSNDPYYDVSLNDHSFDTLIKSIKCYFEYKKEYERERWQLCLRMKIKGTNFNGYALLEGEEDELHETKSN